jgi:hypothetical protein
MPWQIGDTCSDVIRAALKRRARAVSPAIHFNRLISANMKVFARGQAAKIVVGSILARSALATSSSPASGYRRFMCSASPCSFGPGSESALSQPCPPWGTWPSPTRYRRGLVSGPVIVNSQRLSKTGTRIAPKDRAPLDRREGVEIAGVSLRPDKPLRWQRGACAGACSRNNGAACAVI